MIKDADEDDSHVDDERAPELRAIRGFQVGCSTNGHEWILTGKEESRANTVEHEQHRASPCEGEQKDNGCEDDKDNEGG